ncbi:MAG: DUF31 family putative serine protease [Mycoplasmoidaceae bacterium]
MKLAKWLAPILTSSLVIASGSFGLVGCDKTEEPEQTYEQFIYDRTFSLFAFQVIEVGPESYVYGDGVFGTGWIIDDATPEIKNDYIYHVATNWHVIAGFDHLFYEPVEEGTYVATMYAYADSSLSSDSSQIIDFRKYVSLGYEDEGFYQKEEDFHTFMDVPYEPPYTGIDLYEADINFNSVDNWAKTYPKIKAKLDRLNQYRTKHGYINKFVCADKQEIQDKKKYTGGYPYKNNPQTQTMGGRWETHQIDFDLYYAEAGEFNHTVQLEGYEINDKSPQYYTETNMGPDWMTGGASGSMLLTEDYEICGIYWGGWGNWLDPDIFYPSFSLFNTTNRNYLEKYIHN